MSTAALFTIATKQKPPKCPSAEEWMNKILSIHITDYYSAIKRKEILL